MEVTRGGEVRKRTSAVSRLVLMRIENVTRRFGWALFAVSLVIAATTTLPGQSARKGDDIRARTVQGSVQDAGGNAVTGAIVQLKNTKTLQIRSFITKEQGEYFFNGLSPDVDFELRAEFNGASSGTKTLSSFDSRKQAVLNLKLDK